MLESINLFLWLWKCCGVCEIRVKKLKNGLLTLESAHPFVTVLALAQCVLTLITGSQEVYDTIHDDSTLKMRKGRVMFTIDLAMVSCTVISGICSSIYHRSSFKKILIDLEDVEQQLQKLSRRKHKAGVPTYIKVSYVVNVTAMIATLVYDAWAWSYVFYSFTVSYQFSYLSFFASTTLILKFIYVVSYVKKQFEWINTLFKETVEIIFEHQRATDQRRYLISTKIRLTHLNKLMLLHDKLYHLIARINAVFGLVNIFSLLYMMEQLVCCPFYSIANRQLFDPNKNGIEHFIYLYILWSVAVLFLLITMLNCCSQVKQEALELRKIVARYMNPLKTTDFADEYIILYLMKLNKPYHGFTVFGLVELELPLARAMIGTSMTYLMIFLQF